ncbi:neuroparsin-A isoform X1 [Nilaparvata lugens]|uniref:neuroparsin-A isoform X1 n=1 Tax=Nilaparvata lugens TaxID=108931 RepID=UPI00193EA0B8|nr:neuroparsin-A isoform X1 [Nilaparvata lugens]
MQSLFLTALLSSIVIVLALPEWNEQRGEVPLESRRAVNACGDVKCHFGGYVIQRGQESTCFCYKGPGEVCGGHDNNFVCETGLECNSCGICVGCANKISYGFMCYDDDNSCM